MSQKPELYRWKSSAPNPSLDFGLEYLEKNYKSSKKPMKIDAIEDWMKTVEAASERAIRDVFGRGGPGSKQKATSTGVTTVNLREHEAAYAEAQDLLNEWMKDKITFEPEELDYVEEYRGPTQSDIRKQWDSLLNQDHYRVDEEPKQIEYDFDLEKEDTDDIVGEILQNFMKKEVVNASVKKDLALKREEIFQGPDPRTKMQLRREQVKANREKREMERQIKMEQKQKQKDVHIQAKQIVMKEEREKHQKHRHEELLVQKEVAKLRREMMEQRKAEEELKQKNIEAEKRLRYEAQMELDQQQWQEEQLELESRFQEEKRRKEMEIVKQIQAKVLAKERKMQQSVFSAWYNVVLERRLQLGKVQAMADWKLQVRSFNAWKSFTRHNRLDRETQIHQQYVKEHSRKHQLAIKHHERRLLKRCVDAWKIYVKQMETTRETERERAQTKSKMASFLALASSGKLFNEKKSDDERVSGIFASKQAQQITKRPESARSMTSTRSSSRTTTSAAKSKSDVELCRQNDVGHTKPPIHAWQVNRKHLGLTPDQISELGQGEGHSPRDENAPERKREIHHRMHKWTTPEIVPIAGAYENRHKAQQQILKMQREQLKEQQKMIEELKYIQNQQMLQQQLHQQQLETQRLNNMPIGEVPVKRLSSAKTSVKTNSETSYQTTREQETDRSRAMSFRSDLTNVSSSRTASLRNNKKDDFVRKMEERAAERTRLKEERERRRREQEQEKLAKLEAEQFEQRQREEEEKLAKIEAKKEQKRMEKQLEFEKLQFQERLKVMTSKAAELYERSQLKYRGLLPWKRYVEVGKQQWRTARWHHESRILRYCLHEWLKNARESAEEKGIRAERFYDLLAAKRCFRNWKRLGQVKSYLRQKADNFYRIRLLWRLVQAWHDYCTDEKLRMWKLERMSKEHDVTRLQNRCFVAWRKLPSIEAEERAREKRLAEMRAKVAAMLPDFQKSFEAS